MADRFPLIVDSTTQTIKELPSGDNLDLTGSSIVNASSIDVTGTLTADGLTTNDDVSLTNTLGRYSSGFPYSLVRPSSTATGIEIRTNAGNALAHFLNDGTTNLHHNGGIKLTTTATGIDVTGTIKSASATQSTLYLSNAAKTTGFLVGRSLASNDAQDFFIYDVTAASTRLVIDSSGLVGIGTSSPSAAIHATTATAGYTAKFINTNGASDSNGLLIQAGTGATEYSLNVADTAGTTNFMVVKGDGNVGIGTTSPAAPLSFGANIPSDGQTIHTYHSGNVRSGLGIVAGAHRMFTNSTSVLSFGQVSDSDGSTYTERMRITSAGNVGINDSSPYSPLSVTTTGTLPQDKFWYEQVNMLTLNGTRPRAGLSTAATAGGNAYDGDMLFYNMYYDGGADYQWKERMRITSTGNVGIGISIPSERLNLAQSVPSTYTAGLSTLAAPAGTNLRIENNSTVTDTFTGVLFVPTNGAGQPQISYMGSVSTGSGLGADIVFGRRESSTYYAESMRIDASGNLLVGTTSAFGTTGTTINPAGLVYSSADGDRSGQFDRTGVSDGEIVRFTKAGAGVGSIGCQPGSILQLISEGTELYVGTSGNAESFFDAPGGVAFSTFTAYDGLSDLGRSSARFKDLYLSGAVIIDADGAANNAWTHFKNDDRTWLVGCRGSDGDSFTIYDLTADEPRVKVDASGNLLVGTTTVPSQTTGVSTGVYFVVKGDIIPSVDAGFTGHSDLGDASTRYEDAYVRDGVTIGSDGNDKQDIEALSDAEQRVAVACKGLLRKWRWKDAVEEKGGEARIHFGIIAQDLQAAFEAEGLDAGRYAMFMSNTWTDEETGEERTRLGVRYHELLAFIIAAI